MIYKAKRIAKLCANKTSTKPNEIWIAGRNKREFKKDKDVQEIRKKLVEKAKKDINRVEVSEYEKGEYVRA